MFFFEDMKEATKGNLGYERHCAQRAFHLLRTLVFSNSTVKSREKTVMFGIALVQDTTHY